MVILFIEEIAFELIFKKPVGVSQLLGGSGRKEVPLQMEEQSNKAGKRSSGGKSQSSACPYGAAHILYTRARGRCKHK